MFLTYIQMQYKERCGQHTARPTAAAASYVIVDGVDGVDDVEELGELIYQRYPVDLCYNVLGTKWSLRYAQQKHAFDT